MAQGIYDKLEDALQAEGPHILPTSKKALVGKQFRVWAAASGMLSASEMHALRDFVEETYGRRCGTALRAACLGYPGHPPDPPAGGGAPASADQSAALGHKSDLGGGGAGGGGRHRLRSAPDLEPWRGGGHGRGAG